MSWLFAAAGRHVDLAVRRSTMAAESLGTLIVRRHDGGVVTAVYSVQDHRRFGFVICRSRKTIYTHEQAIADLAEARLAADRYLVEEMGHHCGDSCADWSGDFPDPSFR
jgi:hypothetical protein